MDNALVDALVEKVNLGQKSDVSFKLEAYKDMLNASGFGWDADLKMVIATDDVWEEYIVSHPYVERVHRKQIDRYNDLTFMFGNDCAHGSYANTAYSSPLSRRRRQRDEVDSDNESKKNGDETVRLSSDDEDEHDNGSAHCLNEGSQKQSKRVNKGPMETSRGSRNSHSTASGMTRQRREEVDGLNHEDQVRATRLLQKDIVSASFFLKMGHERRKEWVQKLLDRNAVV
ncbi:uncharacterized protein LOC131255109 [Magnolia sinica]|uniref:uncharacterized protein LOC131255109 n=1 Tax=Magnolia sinica TaxID=86752 RepID=UPI002659FDF8|nr:uncharacterized protein LOC131255109 [Magnolia sinica]